MYVITGASGNIGRRVTEHLFAEGKKVRVVGRSDVRLQPFVYKGAEAFVGSLDDELFLTRAFRGVTAVYIMIPPNLRVDNLRAYQNRIGIAVTEALKNTNVRYVVNLSSLGAHLPDKTGPIAGLRDQEQRLNKLGHLNVLHIRPTYFMENLLTNIPLIKKSGTIASSLRGDLAFPIISAKDVADVITSSLLRLNFSGKSVMELLGKREMSMDEMTKIIGKAIGRDDLRYVQLSYPEAEKHMIEVGMFPDVAKSIVRLEKSMNERIIMAGAEPRGVRTETSFEEFARIFAAMYRNSISF